MHPLETWITEYFFFFKYMTWSCSSFSIHIFIPRYTAMCVTWSPWCQKQHGWLCCLGTNYYQTHCVLNSYIPPRVSGGREGGVKHARGRKSEQIDTPIPTKCERERHRVISLCGAIRGCGFFTQGEQISWVCQAERGRSHNPEETAIYFQSAAGLTNNPAAHFYSLCPSPVRSSSSLKQDYEGEAASSTEK